MRWVVKKIDNIYKNGKYYDELYKPNSMDLKESTLWMGLYFKIVKDLFPSIKEYKEKTILEIGASYGGFTNLLIEKGFKNVICSDINKEVISNELKDKLQILDILEITQIEIKKYKTDVIVAFDVFEHINKSEKLVENIEKLLNKGGIVIFCVPYPFKKHLIDKYHTNMQYPSFYTNLFHQKGFDTLSIKDVSFAPFTWRFGIPLYVNQLIKSKFCITETFFCFQKT